MHLTLNSLLAMLVASAAVAEAATLLERQIAFSSIQYTSCAIASGLAVPQPCGASCGLASATLEVSTTQLIKTYTDVISTASYIACNENCLETLGCTQIFFAAGSTCSLYSGPRLYVKGSTTLTYYDIACFECLQPTLSTSSSGTKASTPTPARTSTTTTAKATAPSVTRSTKPAMTWTSVQTDPKSYDMAVTTVFTPPPECTGSLTQIGTNYWQDPVLPAPHTTLTSCYPSQFYSSIVGAANGVSLPPFNPLVCPVGWGSISYNETYIACCPDGFSGIAPNSLLNVQRPLLGVICQSVIIRGMYLDVTSYDSLGSTTVFPLRVGTNGAILLATGFEGIIWDAGSSGTTTAATPSAASSGSVSTTTSVGGAVRNLANFEAVGFWLRKWSG